MDEHFFDLCGNNDYYACELPGRMLVEAQRENVVVPVRNKKDCISLSHIPWYDDKRPGPDYHDIKKLTFDPNARYIVRYVFLAGGQPVKTPYMFAVKTLVSFTPRQSA